MPGKIMYCAVPTRLSQMENWPKLRDEIKSWARRMGYAPVIPFDVGPYEDFEGNPRIGRERTLKYMLDFMAIHDVVGIFGISSGVMSELKCALDLGKEIHVFHGLDPGWEKYYEELRHKYGDLLKRLRGSHHLIALVGQRAVGKTFWSNWLIDYFGDRLRRIKNTTTRQPRDEKDHESYNFISREEFERGIKEYRFLEWDRYPKENGNFYGSSLDDIRAVLKNSHGIFAITPPGVKALYCHRFEINLTIILLVPESVEVMKKNFERRDIHDPDEQTKLMSEVEQFKLPPEMEHFTVSVTGNVEEDQEKLLAIIKPLIK